jgi:hypothetical protein
MRKPILVTATLSLGLLLVGCFAAPRPEYKEKTIGADEYILACLEVVPAGGHTEGEDAVDSCKYAANDVLPRLAGFRWRDPMSSGYLGPWTPCEKARREEELEACQYVPQEAKDEGMGGRED